MRKSIFVANLLSLFVLGYYAISRGIDLVIGVALIISIISNAINIMYEVKYGREKSQTTR